MAKSKPAAVGIDLGTTHSVIAVVDKSGRPCTIRNAEGDLTTPSVVFFDQTRPIVGKEALQIAPFEPDGVAHFAKRDMGEAAYDKTIWGRHLPPEVIEALILRKLKNDAELVVDRVRDVVITVPAYFNEPRRKATQDAGKLAGLNVLDIINEPTAAAIAFGVQQGFLDAEGASRETETVLVYDLGGGTFDVTLMQIEGRDYKTLATAGDVYLGGIDWDTRIVDFVAEEFRRHHGLDPRENDSTFERLRAQAESAKIALTARSDFNLFVEYSGQTMRVNMQREHFESLTRDLLDRTLFTVGKVLKAASKDWSDLTRVLLVGGSTRMPMVAAALEAESGMPADRSISPDESVAHGAAVYAAVLLSADDEQRDDMSVTNVNSHDLGVLAVEGKTGRPRRKVIIPRNTPLPASGKGNFATRDKGQRSVVVNVIEGGDASGTNSTPIGKCIVKDLPPGLPPRTRVEVRFAYLGNGRLHIKARLPETDSEAHLVVERAAGLSDDEIEQWRQRIASGSLFEGLAEEVAAVEVLEVVEEFEEIDDDSSEQFAEADEYDAESEPDELGEADEPQGPSDDELGEFLRRLK